MCTQAGYNMFYESRADKKPRTVLAVRTHGKININTAECCMHAVVADLTISGVNVSVAAVYIKHARSRESADNVLAWLRLRLTEKERVIMAGDFNWYGSKMMQQAIDETWNDEARGSMKICDAPTDRDYDIHNFLQDGWRASAPRQQRPRDTKMLAIRNINEAGLHLRPRYDPPGPLRRLGLRHGA